MTMDHHDGGDSHAALIFLLNCYDVWSATPRRPDHCPAPVPAGSGAREHSP